MWLKAEEIYILEVNTEFDIVQAYKLKQQFQSWKINSFDSENYQFFVSIQWENFIGILIKNSLKRPILLLISADIE